MRGYSNTQISFENDFVLGYSNPNCTIDECKIFTLNGGGINYQMPKPDWLDSDYSSELRYGELYFHATASADGAGTNSDDLIMFIPYVGKDICIAINKALGIKPLSDEVPSETNGPFAINIKFSGTYGFAYDLKVSGNATTGEPNILSGKMAGCTKASGTASTPPLGSYHYFQVLIAR